MHLGRCLWRAASGCSVDACVLIAESSEDLITRLKLTTEIEDFCFITFLDRYVHRCCRDISAVAALPPAPYTFECCQVMPPKKQTAHLTKLKKSRKEVQRGAKRQREGKAPTLSGSLISHSARSARTARSAPPRTHSFTHTLISFVLHMLNCLFDLIQIKSLNHFLMFCVSSFEFNTLQF